MISQLTLSRRNIFLITFGWTGFLASLVFGVLSTAGVIPLPYPYSTLFYLLVVLGFAAVMGLWASWYYYASRWIDPGETRLSR